MTTHEDLIEKILNIEWDMFQRIKSAAPAPCRSAPDNFRKIRGSIYEMWNKKMLESYLSDLEIAWKKGKNLLTEKYARMDRLIPPLNTNPLIDKIVEIETGWQEDMQKQYPAIYNRMCRGTDPAGDGSNFSIYLRSELETYGDKTIELYYKHIRQASDKGENIALASLEKLLRKGGFNDLNHAETYLSKEA